MITAYKSAAEEKLAKLVDAFTPILYEDDEQFLENMKGSNLAGDDIRKYRHWEWTQGVGLYGLWRLFEKTRDEKYLDILTTYFEQNTQPQKIIKPSGGNAKEAMIASVIQITATTPDPPLGAPPYLLSSQLQYGPSQ